LGKKWNPDVLSFSTPKQLRNKTCPTLKYLTHGTPPFLLENPEQGSTLFRNMPAGDSGGSQQVFVI
jgi:hypothetical protein